jgi:hypothetical protein
VASSTIRHPLCFPLPAAIVYRMTRPVVPHRNSQDDDDDDDDGAGRAPPWLHRNDGRLTTGRVTVNHGLRSCFWPRHLYPSHLPNASFCVHGQISGAAAATNAQNPRTWLKNPYVRTYGD